VLEGEVGKAVQKKEGESYSTSRGKTGNDGRIWVSLAEVGGVLKTKVPCCWIHGGGLGRGKSPEQSVSGMLGNFAKKELSLRGKKRTKKES